MMVKHHCLTKRTIIDNIVTGYWTIKTTAVCILYQLWSLPQLCSEACPKRLQSTQLGQHSSILEVIYYSIGEAPPELSVLWEAYKNALEALDGTFHSLSEGWEYLGSLKITRSSDSSVCCAVTSMLNISINLYWLPVCLSGIDTYRRTAVHTTPLNSTKWEAM